MYSIRIARIWPACIALVAGPLLLAACGGSADAPEGGGGGAHHVTTQGEELPTVAFPARWAWGDAENLGTLVRSADVVFRGNVVSLEGQRPTLSRPGATEPGAADPGAQAPRFADFPVSQFEVRVEKVISGNLTSGTVVIEQIGGVETRPDGTQVRLMLKGDPPLEIGETYLFFGSFQEDGSLVAAPFGRMKVRPNGSLVAEAGWGHMRALAQLSRGNLGDAERQIRVAAGE